VNARQQRYYNEFRERVEAQGGTVVTSGWKNNRTPMLVRCKVGHLAMPRPGNVQKGQRICRACAGKDPAYAWNGFRDRVRELGGEVLEPEWRGKDVPHRVRCAEGHETAVSPNNVRKGQGVCRFCAGRETTPEQAAENFRRAVADHDGEVLEPAWLGALATHRIRCAEGHEATVRPTDVQQGQGICRYCAGRVWNVFYIVADDDNDVIKFGISSGDPRDRLADHRRDGFERTILVRTNFPGARELETRILRALADAGEQPVRGREYYPARVLATVLDIAGHDDDAA